METRKSVGHRLTGEFSYSLAAACFYTVARFARSRWRRSLARRVGGAKGAALYSELDDGRLCAFREVDQSWSH